MRMCTVSKAGHYISSEKLSLLGGEDGSQRSPLTKINTQALVAFSSGSVVTARTCAAMAWLQVALAGASCGDHVVCV